MIDVRLLRQDPEGVRAALARRNKPELLEQLAEAISLEGQARELQSQRDTLRAEINDLSKQVGQARKDGNADAADALQAKSREMGDRERVLAAEADDLAIDAGCHET